MEASMIFRSSKESWKLYWETNSELSIRAVLYHCQVQMTDQFTTTALIYGVHECKHSRHINSIFSFL